MTKIPRGKSYSRLNTGFILIVVSFVFVWMLFCLYVSSLGNGASNGFYFSAMPHDNNQKLNVAIQSNSKEALHSKYVKMTANVSSQESRLVSVTKAVENRSNGYSCSGKYIYIHRLPAYFNEDILRDCEHLSLWTDMCKYISNGGLGPPLMEGIHTENTGWHATNQFVLDVIFHNRMKQYECLTNDSSMAAAVYVPFYVGLDISRYLWGWNTSVRDSASLALAKWLTNKTQWAAMGGGDHFLVAGRITWDFRRKTMAESEWGNQLLYIPSLKNMTMLVVEASPWDTNDFAIPYPTYFHPAKSWNVIEWQNRMRILSRTTLFSFAGAPRPEIKGSIRGQIIDQCTRSKMCRLLGCDDIKGQSTCHSPVAVMKLFEKSVFCLQPQGDSYTRRSIFDSIVAGCIPVLFHLHSAYSQYVWHLPMNHSKYSVFIPEDEIRKRNVNIEQRLIRIPEEEVKMMREEVIDLIPAIIYADPRSRLESMKDAFDIAVEGVIDKVTKLKTKR